MREETGEYRLFLSLSVGKTWQKRRLEMNRMFSLNDVSTEFAVEELEPRLEMQMLGVGADPGIIFFPSGYIATGILITSGGRVFWV